VPKPTQLSYGVTQVLQPDREKHRIEKIKAVMDQPNLDLGMWWCYPLFSPLGVAFLQYIDFGTAGNFFSDLKKTII
jgi:hypothetical protein